MSVRQCCQWRMNSNMNTEKIRRYARLAIRNGVNLQKDQTLLIDADIHAHAFVRLAVKEAYEAGAKEVLVHYHDALLDKYAYEYESEQTLSAVHTWQIDRNLDYLKEGACRLHIISPLPQVLKDCDPQKMAARAKALGEAMKEVRNYTTANKVQWSIIAVPNKEWAKQVFPALSEHDAMEQLWRQILTCVYVEDDNDPIQTWEQRDTLFQERIQKLNAYAFQRLHFTSELGTDLYVGLPRHHIWAGGSDLGQNKVRFNANIPTEEVFTAPHCDQIEGIVVASKPLLYSGNLIKDFSLRFEAGKVVEYHAKEGEEVLGMLLEMDEGSRYLGEVALVPYDSPISQSQTLFYSTLFDENASCHLALGAAYPSCIEGGLDMSEEQLRAKGVNVSISHVDFMFGTKEMRILGECSDGTWVSVFEHGNFVM